MLNRRKETEIQMLVVSTDDNLSWCFIIHVVLLENETKWYLFQQLNK